VKQEVLKNSFFDREPPFGLHPETSCACSPLSTPSPAKSEPASLTVNCPFGPPVLPLRMMNVPLSYQPPSRRPWKFLLFS